MLMIIIIIIIILLLLLLLLLLNIIIIIIINKDLVKQRLAKINDKNQRFSVFVTLLSRRNKNYKICSKV